MPGTIMRHRETFKEAISRNEFLQEITNKNWYGYHPNGYGGWVERATIDPHTGREGISTADGKSLSTVWYYCHYSVA